MNAVQNEEFILRTSSEPRPTTQQTGRRGTFRDQNGRTGKEESGGWGELRGEELELGSRGNPLRHNTYKTVRFTIP